MDRIHAAAPILILFLILATGPALAQEDSDAAALSLANLTPRKVEAARSWQIAVETALEESRPRSGGPAQHGQRLSLDVQFDQSIARDWRAVFSDQLDLRGQAQRDTVNTLKEAYLSWQPQAEQVFDIGRINARYGVASGYNPTDLLRGGATRSITLIDPGSLQKNRLGSVMLRGQTLWDGGALTAMVVPKLAAEPSDAPFSADLGATNDRNRWLLALSQRLSENMHPQWLLYGEDHLSPQLGLNLTYLLNDATVAHLEWSGGRSPLQLEQALQTGDNNAFRSRLSTGLTYTTSNKISLTAEYEFNGAGLDREDWETLSRHAPLAYLRYRQWTQDRQDMPTRQSLFFYARWQDAIVNHLDFNAMLRINREDRSRLSWLEARYHWDKADLALQWQHNSGTAGSEFGALLQSHALQALVRYFF
ncbi:MAG: hypothetical protein ACOH2K_08485 [Burkholderiaceae bacterium]